MTAAEKVSIVLFSGGRGTATITETFLKHSQIDLTILVNAYDDGLSTGRLRRYIPGMLGPSDVRKNLSRLIPETERSLQALKHLLEYRLPDPIPTDSALRCLEGLVRRDADILLPELRPSFWSLTLSQAAEISRLVQAFLAYHLERRSKGIEFDFGDCSLGNLFFAGSFLLEGRDFNRATAALARLCEARGKLLNVTLGESLVLTGLKEDGTYLSNEAEIVSKQNSSRLSEIFLLEDYLDPETTQTLRGKSSAEISEILRQRSVWPKLNPDAQAAIEGADIIIYGPGTQHSSLFPSYLTEGLAQAIVANTDAEKIFIANIRKDHEIQNEDAVSLTAKLRYYLNAKGRCDYPMEKLATSFFFQAPKEIAESTKADYLAYHTQHPELAPANLIVTDWEEENGTHSGGRVMQELISIVNTRLQKKMRSFHSSVSIIVPCLNEERSVKQVLHELELLDLASLGLRKEIIFVDGGSRDRSLELARTEIGVKALGPGPAWGRGAALRQGIERATGNVIVFFPSDGEYTVDDLPAIIAGIVKNEFQVVFGSRAIKCINLSKRIMEIYEGNRLNYLVSKYGGMLLSVISLLLYNRFISDPFTSIKAFDAKLLRMLNLRSNGVDLETEIIAKLGKLGVFILEVPVDYAPRTKRQGKKTSILDGVRALLALFRYRFFGEAKAMKASEAKYENSLNHNSRL